MFVLFVRAPLKSFMNFSKDLVLHAFVKSRRSDMFNASIDICAYKIPHGRGGVWLKKVS